MEECFRVIKKTVKDKSALCYVSPKQIPSWEKYIDFVEDFCKVYDLDQDLVAINVKKNAVIPLLSYKKDSEMYITTCRQIAATLKSQKCVTRKAIDAFMGVIPKTPPLKKTVDAPPVPRIVMRNAKMADLTARNQGLISSIEVSVINGLRTIMERDGLDCEYAALCRAVSNEVKRG